MDWLFIAITIAFLVVSVAFVRMCESLGGER
jgi:hypothetical protein